MVKQSAEDTALFQSSSEDGRATPDAEEERSCLHGLVACFFRSANPTHGERGTEGNYTIAHLLYSFVFSIGILGSFSALLFPRFMKTQHLDWCSPSSPRSCPATSYITVYRLQFAVSTFFLVLLLVQLAIFFKDDKIPRGYMHKGWWIPKLCLISLLIVAAYFIPGKFFVGWAYIGITGAVVFVHLQLFFLLDASRSCSRFLLDKREQCDSPVWIFVFWTAVGTLYLSSAVLVALAFWSYSKVDHCGTSSALMTFTAGFSILAIVLIVTTKSLKQEILTASTVAIYSTFLAYSATSYGQRECNPERAFLNVTYAERGLDGHVLEEVELIYVLTVYACMRKGHPGHFRFWHWNVSRGVNTSNEEDQSHPGADSSRRAVGEGRSVCSPLLVYAVLFLACLHSMMASTHWLSPAEEELAMNFKTNMFVLFLKTTSPLTVSILYMWTLVAPTLIPNTDATSLTSVLTSLAQFSGNLLNVIFIQPWTSCKGSHRVRFVYTSFLLTGITAACVMYSPGVRRWLETSPHFCSRLTHMGNCFSTDPAYLAVYRICFSMAAFFLLFAIILCCVRSRRDPRDLIQNGLWIVKFCLFFGLLVCSFFFPVAFGKTWLYFGLMGTFFFSVIQMFLLTDFSNLWMRNWAEKAERTGRKVYFRTIVAVTVFLYVLSFAALVCFFIFFAPSRHCQTNRLFLSINVVMCAVAAMISIHPKGANGGLLQSAIVSSYTMFLTWSAFSYNPNEKCNPVASYVSATDMRPSLNAQATLELILLIVTIVYVSVRIVPLSDSVQTLIAISSSLFRSVLKRDDYRNEGEKSSDQEELLQPEDRGAPPAGNGGSVDDGDAVQYNYSLFHWTHFVTSLHVTMVLTNWFSPQDGSDIKLSINWAAMCIKLTSSSFCILLYVWSLAVPILMKWLWSPLVTANNWPIIHVEEGGQNVADGYRALVFRLYNCVHTLREGRSNVSLVNKIYRYRNFTQFQYCVCSAAYASTLVKSTFCGIHNAHQKPTKIPLVRYFAHRLRSRDVTGDVAFSPRFLCCRAKLAGNFVTSQRQWEKRSSNRAAARQSHRDAQGGWVVKHCSVFTFWTRE